MIELVTTAPGYSPTWALGGMIVVVIFLALILVGWVIEFAQKHKPLIVVFILTVLVAGILWFISGDKIS